MLKVNLIVVSGKPEGKVIPLLKSTFRIGRDETCDLRPNSVEVSRQHTEITVTDTTVTVQDLGSRNGTMVNGKLLSAPHRLKSGELLRVGPLTFAVSIQETAEAAAVVVAAPAAPARPPTLDDMPQGQIESWLVADNSRPTPDRPSGVYDGDTLTIDAYTGAGGQIPGRSNAAKPPSTAEQPTTKPASSPALPTAQPESKGRGQRFDDENLEFERLEEGAGDNEEETVDADSDGGEESEEETAGEFLDPSNPFYIAKKTKGEEQKPSKQSYKDTSDAANDILRKMLERRRASR